MIERCNKWLRNATAACAVAVCFSATAEAQSADSRMLYFGAGVEDVGDKHSTAPGVLLEYASRRFWDLNFGVENGFRWRIAAMASTDADFWLGIGPSYELSLGQSPWYLEGSVLPGVFWRGNATGTDERVHSPQFRSQIALGYRFDSGSTLSMTLSHRSNGGQDSANSSMETI